MKINHLFFAMVCLIMSTVAMAQKSVKSELFNRDWKSPYLSTSHSEKLAVENSLPTGFNMKIDKNFIYRDWYFIMPGSVSDTFSKAIDTFDLNKKVIAYSPSGRRIESTVTLADDHKSIHFVRNYFNTTNTSIIDFTYNETYKLLEDGNVMLEKTAHSDDPNSNFNFVADKKYPKDPEEHLKKAKQLNY